ncbi:MAG: hypothetical protein KDK70_33080 [Myxococcales bacterium]|nr:hypothetical protein [Myxococcales bacterium]
MTKNTLAHTAHTTHTTHTKSHSPRGFAAASLLLLLAVGCRPGSDDDGSQSSASSTTGSDSGDDSSTTSDAADSTSDTDGASGGGESGTTGDVAACDDPGLDSCCCFGLDASVDATAADAITLECEEAFPVLCEPAVLTCDDPSEPSDGPLCAVPEVAIDVETIDCMLVALMERQPGRLELETVAGGGLATARATLLVAGEQAMLRRGSLLDLEGTAGPVVRGTLRPPGDFEVCLEAFDALEKLDCLLEPLEGPPQQECIAAMDYSEG